MFMTFFFTDPNSPLKAFLLQSAKMSSEEKAAFLEKDEVTVFVATEWPLKELTEQNIL